MAIVERCGRFGARVETGCEQVWLGTFDTQEEADAAVLEAREAIAAGRFGDGTVEFWLRGIWNATVGEYLPVLAADPCAYCVGPGGHLDHIEPRAGGGENGWANLTSACSRCNSRKNDRSLLGFLGWKRERDLADAHLAEAARWDGLRALAEGVFA